MRKAEVVQRILEVTDQTQVKTEEAVDTILAEIKSTLEAGESVILRRFYFPQRRGMGEPTS